jgi:hypothetical protein
VQVTNETSRASPELPLRQGDILRIDPTGDGSPELGVVINADCDLEHNKTDGVVAYLPIYRFRAYLEQFWAPGHVAELKHKLHIQIQQICDIDEPDLENLDRWLLSSDATEISTKLAVGRELKTRSQEQLVEAVSKLRVCLDTTMDPFEVFLTFCRYEKDPAKHARKQISAAKKAIADGHFFVSEIVGEPDVGFVIRMRRIYTIDARSCFPSNAALERSGTVNRPTAVRFAHLTPMYSYRVAQLFAQQFSRIGLPDEVTALGELAIEDIVTLLEGGS